MGRVPHEPGRSPDPAPPARIATRLPHDRVASSVPPPCRDPRCGHGKVRIPNAHVRLPSRDPDAVTPDRPSNPRSRVTRGARGTIAPNDARVTRGVRGTIAPNDARVTRGVRGHFNVLPRRRTSDPRRARGAGLTSRPVETNGPRAPRTGAIARPGTPRPNRDPAPARSRRVLRTPPLP